VINVAVRGRITRTSVNSPGRGTRVSYDSVFLCGQISDAVGTASRG
jgi:hypothetical protein